MPGPLLPGASSSSSGSTSTSSSASGSSSSAQISFSQVSANLRTPFIAIEIDPSAANGSGLQNNLPALMIGSYLNTQSAVVANEPIQIFSSDQAGNLFGSGTQLHEMFIAWFANNQDTPVFAAPVPDAGGASVSTWTLTVTIPTGSIQNGTYPLYINGVAYPVGITAGMTVTQAAAAIVAEVNAAYGCPVTAANTAGVVTLTSVCKGAFTALIDVRQAFQPTDVMPGNMAVAIASATSGATNPSLATLIANIVNNQYQFWVMPYTDSTNIGVLDTELVRRFGAMVNLPGFGLTALNGSQGTLATYGEALNCQTLCVMGYDNSPSSAWQWAAALAGQVSASASEDPARPFNTLPLVGIQAPPLVSQWTQPQANALLYDGIATSYVDSGGTVRIMRLITTYQKDVNGAASIAYLDLNSPLVLCWIRADLVMYIQGKYPRSKLANDGTRFGIGQAVVTPSILKAEIIARARYWEELALIDNVDGFATSLIVVRNSSDPTRVDVFMAPELISSLQIVGVLVQYLLGG